MPILVKHLYTESVISSPSKSVVMLENGGMCITEVNNYPFVLALRYARHDIVPKQLYTSAVLGQITHVCVGEVDHDFILLILQKMFLKNQVIPPGMTKVSKTTTITTTVYTNGKWCISYNVVYTVHYMHRLAWWMEIISCYILFNIYALWTNVFSICSVRDPTLGNDTSMNRVSRLD